MNIESMSRIAKISIIATELLEWPTLSPIRLAEVREYDGYIDGRTGHTVYDPPHSQLYRRFDPYVLDCDCMMVWDEFCQTRRTVLRKCGLIWTAIERSFSIGVTNTSRATAMMDCVVQVLLEEKEAKS